MGIQAENIAAAVRLNGIPEPWRSFGACMDAEGHHVHVITTAIDQARKDDTPENRAQVRQAFTAKYANVDQASLIVTTMLTDLDRDNGWAVLDGRASRLDIDDVSVWAQPEFQHPLPIQLNSLQFNWRYMKTHGVRGFYEMTLTYLADLRANTDKWLAAWDNEIETGTIDYAAMLEAELIALEAPMHCGVCKKTVAAVLYLD